MPSVVNVVCSTTVVNKVVTPVTVVVFGVVLGPRTGREDVMITEDECFSDVDNEALEVAEVVSETVDEKVGRQVVEMGRDVVTGTDAELEVEVEVGDREEGIATDDDTVEEELVDAPLEVVILRVTVLEDIPVDAEEDSEDDAEPDVDDVEESDDDDVSVTEEEAADEEDNAEVLEEVRSEDLEVADKDAEVVDDDAKVVDEDSKVIDPAIDVVDNELAAVDEEPPVVEDAALDEDEDIEEVPPTLLDTPVEVTVAVEPTDDVVSELLCTSKS
ncbi:hypothetical protein BD414DRAFT_536695 [Trametes punicea]|nr:hypothetical protein BD414DRAFT_536695 [Trametes punicea]